MKRILIAIGAAGSCVLAACPSGAAEPAGSGEMVATEAIHISIVQVEETKWVAVREACSNSVPWSVPGKPTTVEYVVHSYPESLAGLGVSLVLHSPQFDGGPRPITDLLSVTPETPELYRKSIPKSGTVVPVLVKERPGPEPAVGSVCVDIEVQGLGEWVRLGPPCENGAPCIGIDMPDLNTSLIIGP